MTHPLPSITAILHAGMMSSSNSCVWLLWIGMVFVLGVTVFHPSWNNRSHPLPAPLLKSAFNVWMGFALGFALLGGFATGITSPLGTYFIGVRKFAGLWLLGVSVYLSIRPSERFSNTYCLGYLLTGLCLACAWIPCVGPILGHLLQLAADPSSQLGGVSRLFVYALGLGGPFVVLVAIGVLLQRLIQSKQICQTLFRISCAGLSLYGLLILTGQLMRIYRWLPLRPIEVG